MRPQTLLSLSALVAPAAAQALHYEYEAKGKEELFGMFTAGVGDVDADGWPDFAYAAIHTDKLETNAGTVFVRSGRTGKLLHRIDGTESIERLGDVEGLGDVDGDGHDDFLIGAGWAGQNDHGRVRLHSGADASVLWEIQGTSQTRFFGMTVTRMGDLDGDGVQDFATTSSAAHGYQGAAYLMSGRDGALLREFVGLSSEELSWCGPVGDLDGDGRNEVGVGGRGVARVYSSGSGALLHEHFGPDYSYGHPVVGVGDRNADGIGDYLVCHPLDDLGGQDAGAAFLHSGADGALLQVLVGDGPGDLLGIMAAQLGDLDGDGAREFAVAASAGYVRIHSGADGALLARLAGGATFGWGLADAGDLNRDGLADVVVGQPGNWGQPVHGWVYVYLGAVSLGTPLCDPARPNSTGVAAHLTAFGSPAAGGWPLELRVAGLPPGREVLLLASRDAGFVPFPGGSQGALCLEGEVGRLTFAPLVSDAAGEVVHALDTLALPTVAGPYVVLPGETWLFQAWYRDDDPQPTSNFSDARRVEFR